MPVETNQKIKSPHDRYYRSLMSDLRVAREFFHEYLPENIRQLIDLNTLQLRKESFVDKTLRSAITDMLFSVHLKEEAGYLYFLHEHKSKPNKLLPLDLWKYLLLIVQQHIKETKTSVLPVVYPIIYYNGRVSYPFSTDFFDLFGKHKSLAKQILTNPFQVVDLTKISDEQLREKLWIGIMGFMMKHVRRRDLVKRLETIASLFKQAEYLGGKDYIETTLYYLLNASKIENPEDFIELICQNLSQELGENVMTLAERIRREGKAQGLAEGIEQGENRAAHSIALNMLQKRISLDIINETTGLSLEEIIKLKEKLN